MCHLCDIQVRSKKHPNIRPEKCLSKDMLLLFKKINPTTPITTEATFCINCIRQLERQGPTCKNCLQKLPITSAANKLFCDDCASMKKKNRDKAAYDESTDLDYIANLEKKLEDANKKIAAEREKNNKLNNTIKRLQKQKKNMRRRMNRAKLKARLGKEHYLKATQQMEQRLQGLSEDDKKSLYDFATENKDGLTEKYLERLQKEGKIDK